MIPFRCFYPLISCLFLLSACTAYNEKPLDLSREDEIWRELSEKAVAEDGGKIRREQALKIGLLMNPALNRSRAELRRSRDVEAESGYWEDPSVGFGNSRKTRENADAWTHSVTLNFTIPLTGLPALAEKIAGQYAEADYWRLVQEETDFRVELEQQMNSLEILNALREYSRGRLEQVREERRVLEKLFEAGEISAGTLQETLTEELETVMEERAFAADFEKAEIRFGETLGLAPGTKFEFSFSGAGTLLTEFSGEISAETLASLPKVKAALAKYAASETALQTEIRRQYPELTLSPGFSSENYKTPSQELSLGIGVTIPLWNRNRVNIAAAEGDREIVRRETLAVWKSLYSESESLKKSYALARERFSAQKMFFADLRARERLFERLFKNGETGIGELIARRRERYAAEKEYFASLETLANLRLKLLSFQITKP